MAGLYARFDLSLTNVFTNCPASYIGEAVQATTAIRPGKSVRPVLQRGLQIAQSELE
jgi:hypothetical protein